MRRTPQQIRDNHSAGAIKGWQVRRKRELENSELLASALIVVHAAQGAFERLNLGLSYGISADVFNEYYKKITGNEGAA